MFRMCGCQVVERGAHVSDSYIRWHEQARKTKKKKKGYVLRTIVVRTYMRIRSRHATKTKRKQYRKEKKKLKNGEKKRLLSKINTRTVITSVDAFRRIRDTKLSVGEKYESQSGGTNFDEYTWSSIHETWGAAVVIRGRRVV